MESPAMKDAFEEIRRLSENPATRALAISREINLRDQMQREYDARQDGKEKGVGEMVLHMYSKQMSAAAIAELTGITVDTVLKIIESAVH